MSGEFFIPSDLVRQWFAARIEQKLSEASAAQRPDHAKALKDDANELEAALAKIMASEQYIQGAKSR